MANPDAIRSEWTALWERLLYLAQGMKNPQAAVVELSLRFGQLGPAARPVVEKVLADWLDSDESGLRFVANSIVRDYHLTSALPALRHLEARLQTMDGPLPRGEREKILRTIDKLEKS